MTNEDAIAGLIFAYELDGSGGARPLLQNEVEKSAEGPRLTWAHLDLTAPEGRNWIRKFGGVTSDIADILLEEDTRPRTFQHDNGLVVILRGVNLNAGAEQEDMVAIRLWMDSRQIISTQRRSLQSVAGIQTDLLSGSGPTTPAEFLLRLIEQLGNRIEPMIDQLEETIEAAEHTFSGDGTAEYRGQLSALRRRAAQIRRFLTPQREALDRLSREPLELLSDSDRFKLREEVDQITRYLETLDLARERAMVAQEEVIAQLAQEQNRRMYVLSIVAAIFLPLSFLTGLLGMNVAGLPGLEDEDGFLISAGFMLLVAVAIVVIFRIKKWL
jgi:zinc transporter